MHAGELLPSRRQRDVAANAEQERHAESNRDQQEDAAESQRRRSNPEAERRRPRASSLFAHLDTSESNLFTDERPQVVENAADQADGRFLNEVRVRHGCSESNPNACERQIPNSKTQNPNPNAKSQLLMGLRIGTW